MAEKCRVLKELSSVHSGEASKIKNCLHDNEKCGEALLAVSRDCTKLLEEKAVHDILKKASDIEPLKTKLKDYKSEWVFRVVLSDWLTSPNFNNNHVYLIKHPYCFNNELQNANTLELKQTTSYMRDSRSHGHCISEEMTL